MNVVLYTTHCPKCKILEKKLNQKNIPFEVVTDIELMKEKEYFSVPILELDGIGMNFKDANEWINKN